MANKDSVVHYLQYFLLRCLEAVINVLPRKLTLAIGAFFGDCFYYCGVYRRVVSRNMQHTGLFDAQQQKMIMKKLYRNMGRYAADFLRSSQKLPLYTIEHPDVAQSVSDAGKGTLVVMAHFGNWEILGPIFGARFSDLHVLTKPMHNQVMERWLFSKRMGGNVTPIYASQALRKMVQVLKRYGMIALLIDQNAGRNGSPSNFLGKPANTVRTVAGLFHKLQCGVIFAYGLLEKNGTYRIVIEDGPRLAVSPNDPEQFITAYQQAHNDVLSRWITEYPEHYFGWFHRRFRGFLSYK
jgi:KDO2-lipid IV(A) lauroyltransferase